MKIFSKALFTLDVVKVLERYPNFKKDIEASLRKDGWATIYDQTPYDELRAKGLTIRDDWCYDDEGDEGEA